MCAAVEKRKRYQSQFSNMMIQQIIYNRREESLLLFSIIILDILDILVVSLDQFPYPSPLLHITLKTEWDYFHWIL